MIGILPGILSAFGVAICIFCAAGVFSPTALVRLVRRAWDHPAGIYSAVIVRLCLGVALMIVAESSRFPGIFMVLGLVSLMGAMLIPMIGRDGVGALLAGFENISPWLVRLWLLFGVAFGGFLVYGVW